MNTKSLTQQELINEIETTYQNFNKTLSNFSEKEINTVPFEGSWTAGQVAEHIIKSNGGILQQLSNGKTESTKRRYDEQVSLIQDIFRGKDKMKSAAPLEPEQPPHNADDLLKTLQQQKENQLETIKSKDLKALVSELEFPPSPDGLTRYEWLHLMIEHAQRHSKQLESIQKKL
ncbi:DinB family protein [Arenibacter certesii]|uniref:DinB-like domain-containing protein n=1 Tax=Arenibacter certesii TaxID=228955 RepID=A0A918J3T0_9FLAO|nr:DinB family protein [Arenibacter certesii]GGW41566.1 hypothetical protein GCM10007383_27920 [Arenibacter certesii]